MTTVNAVDYSWGRPDLRTLAISGVQAVLRYINDPGGKGVTREEINQIHAAGLGLGLVYETTAERALSGGAGGTEDARKVAGLCATLGVPDGLPIYYAVDWDITDAQKPTMAAYIHAAHTTNHPARAYGGYYVLRHLDEPGWQTYAWSGGHIHPKAVIYQWSNGETMGGAEVDYNDIRDPDQAGIWWPTTMDIPGPTETDAIVALAVLEGVYGDGDTRRTNLGDRYDQVQAIINHWCELAAQVWAGQFGDGDQRIAALGADYDGVQKAVNLGIGQPDAAAAAPTTYTIQPDDTLSGIAAVYGTDWPTLAQLNGLANPDLIHPGDVLRIR